MKRAILFGIAILAALGFAAPYIDVNFMRPRIERAIQSGLGRRIEVSKVYINLFTGPGFTVEGVTIYDDPRAGIEPLMFVGSMEARVRLLGLLSRRLEFSSLRLHEGPSGEQPTINLVKTGAGPWNFQWLLGATSASGAMPAITMRGGRVNFKFGDTKSVFYFNDADLDVSPAKDGSATLRFSGAPSRTDQAQQNFGHFFVRGRWDHQGLDMRVELERSAIEEVARLFDQRGFGLHGVIALDAQLTGPPQKIDVAGSLRVDDVHRWDLLPKRGGGWSIAYKGSLDLRGERLEILSASEGQFGWQFRASNLLSVPHWEAAADMTKVPLATLVEVARHMGAALSEKLGAEGSVSGTVRYSESSGLEGHVELQDASVTLPDAQPLHAANASVLIEGKTFSLDSTTVNVGDQETADVEGNFESGAGLDVKIATRSLNVTDIKSFGLASIPVVEQTPQGNWRGWARYRWRPGEKGAWTGEYELQNARIPIEGFAVPLRIQSATVSSSGDRVSISRMRARLGEIPISGEYRWDPAAARPHRFKISIARADAAEIERVFAPSLMHDGGFLARTLRLGRPPVPAWLAARRADGTIAIDALIFGDTQTRAETRVLWDGAQIRLAHLETHADPASASGELTIDLSRPTPRYRFDGKIHDVAYKGGRLDLDGTFESEGSAAELILAAQAEGNLKGRSIAFTPDAEFRTVSACFEMSPGLKLKISCLEVSLAGETFSGSGATQADGRLVLELAGRGKQVRYSSPMAAPPSQP